MQNSMGFNLGDFAKLYEHNTQRVLDDVYHLLTSFPSLIPREDSKNNNEGIPETLLCLTGTIPINFRGAKYNIPVMMWVPKLYPHCSPLCFVTPTKEMVIKQSHRNVDPNGQCTVSRIEFWNATTTILEVVTELCAVFSKEPPLFAKPTQQPTSHASFRNSKPLPPTPPPTSMSSSTSSIPSISPPPVHHPPSRYTPPPTTSSSQILSPISSPTSIPLKPHPLTQSTLYQQSDLSRQVTQKMQRALDEFFKATTKDMEMFMANQSMLESRNGDIESRVQTAKQEELSLEQTSAALITKSEELEAWITRMDQPRDIDELIAPRDSLSQQLFNSIAEDHSIDDVLYYLGKALGSGKMDLDSYLKEVRSLSRKQFFARALAMKLRDMIEEQKI